MSLVAARARLRDEAQLIGVMGVEDRHLAARLRAEQVVAGVEAPLGAEQPLERGDGRREVRVHLVGLLRVHDRATRVAELLEADASGFQREHGGIRHGIHRGIVEGQERLEVARLSIQPRESLEGGCVSGGGVERSGVGALGLGSPLEAVLEHLAKLHERGPAGLAGRGPLDEELEALMQDRGAAVEAAQRDKLVQRQKIIFRGADDLLKRADGDLGV